MSTPGRFGHQEGEDIEPSYPTLPGIITPSLLPCDPLDSLLGVCQLITAGIERWRPRPCVSSNSRTSRLTLPHDQTRGATIMVVTPPYPSPSPQIPGVLSGALSTLLAFEPTHSPRRPSSLLVPLHPTSLGRQLRSPARGRP